MRRRLVAGDFEAAPLRLDPRLLLELVGAGELDALPAVGMAHRHHGSYRRLGRLAPGQADRLAVVDQVLAAPERDLERTGRDARTHPVQVVQDLGPYGLPVVAGEEDQLEVSAAANRHDRRRRLPPAAPRRPLRGKGRASGGKVGRGLAQSSRFGGAGIFKAIVRNNSF